MTLNVTSQTISKDSVTLAKKTFKKIMKKTRKSDSLKIAFNKKTLLLDNLVKSNLTLFDDLEQERLKRIKYQGRMELLNEQLVKASKRDNQKWIYGGVGVVIGILIMTAN